MIRYMLFSKLSKQDQRSYLFEKNIKFYLGSNCRYCISDWISDLWNSER